jgi:hypothetical protein
MVVAESKCCVAARDDLWWLLSQWTLQRWSQNSTATVRLSVNGKVVAESEILAVRTLVAQKETKVLLGGGQIVIRAEVVTQPLPELQASKCLSGPVEKKKRGGAHVSVPRFVKKLQRSVPEERKEMFGCVFVHFLLLLKLAIVERSLQQRISRKGACQHGGRGVCKAFARLELDSRSDCFRLERRSKRVLTGELVWTNSGSYHGHDWICQSRCF